MANSKKFVFVQIFTVPVQCPYSAQTVPRQCPDTVPSQNYYKGTAREKNLEAVEAKDQDILNLLLHSFFLSACAPCIRELILGTVSGHCLGTVWALSGHCTGTVKTCTKTDFLEFALKRIFK